MINILANDGLDKIAIERLTATGFKVSTPKYAQADLPNHIHDFEVVIVRSATKIRKPEIDAARKLKLIIRAGVGTDNIDVAYAKSKGIKVSNTPLASSHSVAEMVFAHLFSGARFLNKSNRQMNLKGATHFNELKSDYSKGIELKGKTLGIIGFGNIGMEVARMALSLRMNVLAFDLFPKTVDLKIAFANNQTLSFPLTTVSKEEVITKSDFITVNVSGKDEVLNKFDFAKMKNAVGIINCARGGVANENDLLEYLNNGKISFAGVDVYSNEPTPSENLLKHPKVSLSPHVSSSTIECQQRIGDEVADIVIGFFKTVTSVN
jgi:D-3-phosphoglycerate dehydrogenase / 2-oxoglutarate reductase